MNLTEKQLLKAYKKKINRIADDCDWKTYFSAEEICFIVHSIITKKGNEIKYSHIDLCILYKLKIADLDLTDDEWRESYGIPEIIHLLYNLITTIEI
jgi:hypothetical protein